MPTWLFNILDLCFSIFFRSKIERETKASAEARLARRAQRLQRRAEVSAGTAETIAKNAGRHAAAATDIDQAAEGPSPQQLREIEYAKRGVLLTDQPLDGSDPIPVEGHERYYRIAVVPSVSPRSRKGRKLHLVWVYTYIECRTNHQDSATVLLYRPESRTPYKGFWFIDGEVVELSDSSMAKRIFDSISEEIESAA